MCSSDLFVVVFTVLNVLIGIVLHAMDQAREEGRKEVEAIKELDFIVHQVDDITEDGEVTQEEMRDLRKRIVALDRKMKASVKADVRKKSQSPKRKVPTASKSKQTGKF